MHVFIFACFRDINYINYSGFESNMNRRSFLINLFGAFATFGFMAAMPKINNVYASVTDDNMLTWKREVCSGPLYEVVEINGNSIKAICTAYDNLEFIMEMEDPSLLKVGDMITYSVNCEGGLISTVVYKF
jgi:hypothetical protein